MYKCLDCGHIFDEGEQTVSRECHSEIPGGFYESFASCPCCGGNFEKTKRCEKCLGEFLDDELSCGYCKECLRNYLTAENFLWFAKENGQSENKIDTLEDFVFTKIFGISKAPTESSIELKKMCHATYIMKSNVELILEYMDEIPSLWDDFADYLKRKGVK